VQRIIQVKTTNRFATIALAAAAVAVGGLFLVFGLMLLLGLAAVGTLFGGGVLLFHRLTGRLPRFLGGGAPSIRSLDPALEVHADPSGTGSRPSSAGSLPRLGTDDPIDPIDPSREES